MEFCMHCMVPLAEEARFCPTCGKAQSYDCPPHQLRPGTLLSGRYLLGVALGEGGFGITYIARDIRLGMTVAVKEFYPTGYVSRNAAHSQTVTAVTRGREFFEKGKRKFLDEAHLLAELHEEPGIVDVRDFFEENNTARDGSTTRFYFDGDDLCYIDVDNGQMKINKLTGTVPDSLFEIPSGYTYFDSEH